MTFTTSLLPVSTQLKRTIHACTLLVMIRLLRQCSLPNIAVCAFVYVCVCVCVCVSLHVIVFWGVNNQLTITIA